MDRIDKVLRLMKTGQYELYQSRSSASWRVRNGKGHDARVNLTVRDVWQLKRAGIITNLVGPYANRPGHEAPQSYYLVQQ